MTAPSESSNEMESSTVVDAPAAVEKAWKEQNEDKLEAAKTAEATQTDSDKMDIEEEAPVEAVEIDKEKEKDEEFTYETDKQNLLWDGEFCLNSTDSSFSTYLGYDNSNLFSVQGDGFSQLFAASRATMGFTSGRYLFECKMLEHPRVVRVGFAPLSSHLFLDDDKSIGFEASGDLLMLGERKRGHNARFMKTDIVQVLLNLEQSSPNRNTVSLFLNGTRAHPEPIKLPESFFDISEGEGGEQIHTLKKGMELYPVVCWKGSAIECNFSGRVWKDLSFKVRSVGNALKRDTFKSSKQSPASVNDASARDKTVEVIVPVAFDNSMLMNKIVAEHPDVIVLSKTELALWAEKSGLRKPHQGKWALQCIDQPTNVLPLFLKQGKKYVISLRDTHNFLPAERKDLLARLQHGLNAKVIAHVDADDVVEYVNSKETTGKAAPGELELTHYTTVALPALDEGFADIKFVSSKGLGQTECAWKLAEWRKDCKLKSKIENLKRGEFFNTGLQKFLGMKQLMHKNTAASAQKKQVADKQAAKDSASREKIAERNRKAAEAKKVKDEAKKKAMEERILAGLEGEPEEDKKADEEAAGEEEEVAEEDKDEALEFPQVMDEFSDEDWMLAQLRVEMHLMLHAFRKDVNDEERSAFPAIHFGHYYHVYTGKDFNVVLKMFNAGDLENLTKLVPEVCKHTKDIMIDQFALQSHDGPLLKDYDLIVPALEEELDIQELIALTDVSRQIRSDRLDAGDERSALQFKYKPYNPPKQPHWQQHAGAWFANVNANQHHARSMQQRHHIQQGQMQGQNQKRPSPSGADYQNQQQQNKRQRGNAGYGQNQAGRR